VLYGGFNPGELNIFAGGSGSGKSLFMQNMALNWALMGKNVVYITLELSEELCCMRLDAMLTGMGTRDVMKNSSDVELRVKMASKKAGRLQVIQMKNGSTVNDIKAYLREYQIQHNIHVDALLVDYLDLMMPVTVKVNPSDQFIKDKFVSEELRNLATELGILFVTASQLNRSAVDEIEFDHSHIAGGISKINTADNLIGIFSSRAMRERGRVQIQFMKTRSSSGVGSKLDLKFNMDSLKIEDLDEDEQEDDAVTSIYQKLKTKSSVAPAGETVTENNMDADPQVDATDRLKNLLRKSD
jgi:replicative DNA helicase